MALWREFYWCRCQGNLTALVTTAANEHDLNQLGNLLHGGQFVSADAGYQGAPQRELAEVDVDWLIMSVPAG